jgi:hypothetical protein
MPSTTLLEIPPEEQVQMRAVLRRTRYGYLLAFHILLLCAAGRNPTEIAAFLFCSRSSVYRIVRAYRTGSLGVRIDQDGQLSVAVQTTVLMPWLTRSLGALLKAAPPYLWLVPHAVELRQPRGDAPGQTRHRGVGGNRAPLAPRDGLGVETGQAGGQR